VFDDPFIDDSSSTLDTHTQSDLNTPNTISTPLSNDVTHSIPNFGFSNPTSSSPPQVTSPASNLSNDSQNLSNSSSLPHNLQNSSHTNPAPLRKSARITQPPSYLTKHYYCNLISDDSTIHELPADTSTSSSTCKYPLSSYISYQNLSSAHHHYIDNLTNITEPTCYENAICDENWKAAINSELTALEKYNTWTLVPLPKHKHAIG
jgi:hypothetical protein